MNFSGVVDLLDQFKTDKECLKYIERLRWKDSPVSPFDKSSKVYRCKGGRYKCKNTGKYFNGKTGTIFEDTKIPLRSWFVALFLFSSNKKGISSYQLARELSVTQKTAWFMLHRIRLAMENGDFEKPLSGEVEVDETYVGGKNKNRHFNKRVKGNQGRSFKDKVPVLGMVERGGNVILRALPDVTARTIQPIMAKYIIKGSTVNTDEWKAYKGINGYYNHLVVNHNRGQYVDGIAHTNTIEGFWSIVKRGIFGIYHRVSRHHIERYLKEFSFRYNTREMAESDRFGMVVANCTIRLRYKDLAIGREENQTGITRSVIQREIF